MAVKKEGLQNLFQDRGKNKKTCVKTVGRRTVRKLTFSQQPYACAFALK
jgi:hypothetical protein